MRHRLFTWATRGGSILCLTAFWSGALAHAQDLSPEIGSTKDGWQRYDWLRPEEDPQKQTAGGGTIQATTSQDINDPRSVVANGALWQKRYGATYTRPVTDALSLSYETSAVSLSDGANPYSPTAESGDNLSQTQKVGLNFQPLSVLTLRGNYHDSVTQLASTSATSTTGTAVSAESRLPFNSTLALGMSSDRTGAESGVGLSSDSTAYNAQFSQPLGKIPVTAVFKGRYNETSTAGALQTRTPMMEQSLVWRPASDTTLQMGLRQQQYQNFPGLSSDFNEALFADWSQKLLGDITWHSYAEMLDSRSNLYLAPGVSTSGTNGTPQSTTPGGPSISSTMPLIAEDKTLTFSTGPSFRLQNNISASVEYSNRWDQNPAPGTVGQEQRVSVSLKGTF